jgi:endonuclease/exonuclease/phosphatase (EEP) superfamily protein YafD
MRGREATATPDDPTLPASPRRRLLPLLGVLPALVHPLATLLARQDWRIDVLTTFQLPAVAATVLAAAIALAGRRARLAGVLMGLAALQAAPLLRLGLPGTVRPDPARPARLKLLVANVLKINTDHARLAELIRRELPDIVGLIEVTPEWIAGLEREGVRARFPRRLEWPTGVTGLALWFRDGGPTAEFGDAGRPFLVPPMIARFPWQGRQRSLWLVHPPNFLAREASLVEIEKLGPAIGQDEIPSRIVVGDLNRTSGSPYFAGFLRATALRDSRQGFGEQPSWPTWSPYRIAIDHAFVSPDLTVVSRRLGPDIGSDHLPLILELAPAGPAANAATHSYHSGP